ncbi:YccS family putative transporter [Niveibacterium sp. SC-1]|uniref:YccS family putative transporter n=1 Tax=Niveibacterium sp. SC-1 TaxID=3135646 RepID=UPI0031201F2A
MLSSLTAAGRLWIHDKAIDGAKVAIALTGIVGFCVWMDREQWMIAIILGVIASALAETEDRVPGRFKGLLMTLACFSVAAFSVELLFPFPWFFVLGLTSSTFLFVMLGAAGERYATIATASVILAVYTMLGAGGANTEDAFWLRPALLLAGAAWYGLLSLVAAAIFSTRAARQVLARVFEALSEYLELKAELLTPAAERDEKALRLALAEQNAHVVNALNRARQVLIVWVQERRQSQTQSRYLKWYFLAQDIHERASSSHHPYQALTTAFARSDVLFRISRLMLLQARACTRLAAAIQRRKAFEYGARELQALDEVAAAQAYVQAHPEPAWKDLLEALADLTRNITTIERQLAGADNPDALDVEADNNLRDANPHTLREVAGRIRTEFTLNSSRFRYAIRLSLTLAAGYGLLQLFSLTQGYWVLMTSLFVCQPSYHATWRRMGQRVGGTVLGLFVAWLFIGAFPQAWAQLALAIAAGVAFFALRTDRYLEATACITVLVLVCFNQTGSGYALIVPRLVDTLLGAAIAGAAVAFILPDWQGRRLHQVMAQALLRSDLYLTRVLDQYRDGKHDDLPYRIARRDAHNADAELSNTISAMLAEPDRHQISSDLAFRFLCASQTLLSYVSALGAHREQVSGWTEEGLIKAASTDTHRRLEGIAQGLEHRNAPAAEASPPGLAERLEEIPLQASPAERRVIRQLALIRRATTELETLAAALAH